MRQAAGVELEEGRVLPAGPPRPFVAGEPRVDAAGDEPLQPAPEHQRVGILEGDDGARDAGRHEGVGARRRLALVAAGLERAVERGAGGQQARLGERHRLGVGLAGAEVVAAPDDRAVPDQHGADERVGMRAAAAALREFEGLVHVPLVVQQKRPGAVLQGGRRRGVAACFSHPDCDRRPRSPTWSASEEVRGL